MTSFLQHSKPQNHSLDSCEKRAFENNFKFKIHRWFGLECGIVSGFCGINYTNRLACRQANRQRCCRLLNYNYKNELDVIRYDMCDDKILSSPRLHKSMTLKSVCVCTRAAAAGIRYNLNIIIISGNELFASKRIIDF